MKILTQEKIISNNKDPRMIKINSIQTVITYKPGRYWQPPKANTITVTETPLG